MPSVRQVKNALERIEAQRMRMEERAAALAASSAGGGATSKVAPAPSTGSRGSSRGLASAPLGES